MQLVFSFLVRNYSFSRKFSFSLLLILTLGNSMAQLQIEKNGFDGNALTKSFIPASPTASSFGTYGQMQVNYFTGVPAIDIPLYDLNYKELNVSLNLSYQGGSGIKPGSLPGPVGNGWLLTSGGVITRVSKGISPVSFPNPQSVQASFNYTSYSDWSSSPKMDDNIKTPVYLTNLNCQYDEFAYSFLGLSGKFYTDYNGKKRYKTTQGEDLGIEIQILTSKIITLPNEIQRDETPVTVGTYRNTITLRDIPYKFTITDSKGIVYTFGGTDESIELSRVGRAISNTGQSVKDQDRADKNTEPVSWYLTSIKSPNGYEISFIYQRGQFYVTKSSYVKGFFTHFYPDNGTDYSTGYPTARLIRSSLINPCYLKTITTPNATIQLIWSDANQQLGYKYQADIDYPVANPSVTFEPTWHPDQIFCDIDYFSYADVLRASIDNRFPKKLDYFTVSNSDGAVKTVAFNYTNDVNTRLKLNSVSIKGKQQVAGPLVYKFEYNTLSLPDYLTFLTDGYGYYNGQNLYITSNQPSDYYNNFGNTTWRQSYITSRTPNANYTQAEILQKVTHPTGGYTLYEYENNEYGRIAESWPSNIVDNAGNANLITGGLRIKKISNYDYVGHKAGEKKYFYVKNYQSNGVQSSGVLSYIPKFWDGFNGHVDQSHYAARINNTAAIGTLQYQNWGTDPINPMSVNRSSHITYSEVAEVNEDGGYTIFKYKNFDNGYADRPAINAIYDHQAVSDFWKEDDANSLELERGQIVSEAVYKNGNVKQAETIYEYNDDAARWTDNGKNIRVLKCFPNPFMTPEYGISIRYIATLAYTYYPYLKRKIEYMYPEFGATMVNTTTFSWDQDYRLVKEQTMQTSTGSQNKVVNKYPHDLVALGTTVPYQSMVDKRMISPIIESALYKGSSTFLQSTKTNFNFWINNTWGTNSSASLIVPQTVEHKLLTNASETRVRYHAYDEKGNVLSVSKENDLKESYIWGYNKVYPIAKATNAPSNEIYFSNFEEGGWDYYLSAYDATKSHSGKYAGKIVKLSAGEQVCLSNNWLNVSLSAPTKFKYSGWIYSDGPSAEIFLFMRVAGETNLWTTFDQVITTTVGKWVYIEKEFTVPSNIVQLQLRIDNNGGGTVWYDDIGLRPSAAQMTTYTYDPLIGLTSQIDINNNTLYYEYDDLGRVIHLIDKDKNVVKKYCYNYKGEIENCVAITGSQFVNQPINTNYYSQVCSNGTTPNPYPISISSGIFTSTSTQQDANSQADKYAQELANQYGTCQIANIPIGFINDNSGTTYGMELYNVSTGQYYYFELFYGAGTAGYVPPGTYNIYFDSWGADINSRTYYAGCSSSAVGVGYASLYNVSLSASCNSVSIY